MKKNLTTVLFAVVLLVISTITANAAQTQTQRIELETRSVLLIDKSGSMDMDEQAAVEAALGQYDLASFDAVVNFDHRLSTDSDFDGGGNSHICEVLDQIADSGFTHVVLVTDGEQYPADYSALSVYTDLNLTIHLVEEDEEATEFINQLKSRLRNSNLQVVKPDGCMEVILNNYRHPVYEIEIPVVEEENEGNKTFIQNLKEGYFPWWLILLIAVLIAALFDLIHELITRGRKSTHTMSENTVAAVAEKLGEDDEVEYYVDNSTSFEDVFPGAAEAAKRSGIKTVTTFGSEVKKRDVSELSGLTAQGQTKGWEALETTQGGKTGVMLTDGHFNGKTFDENAFAGKHFRKITVFAPKGYNVANVENLKKIADEVEVLPLQ